MIVAGEWAAERVVIVILWKLGGHVGLAMKLKGPMKTYNRFEWNLPPAAKFALLSAASWLGAVT